MFKLVKPAETRGWQSGTKPHITRLHFKVAAFIDEKNVEKYVASVSFGADKNESSHSRTKNHRHLSKHERLIPHIFHRRTSVQTINSKLTHYVQHSIEIISITRFPFCALLSSFLTEGHIMSMCDVPFRNQIINAFFSIETRKCIHSREPESVDIFENNNTKQRKSRGEREYLFAQLNSNMKKSDSLQLLVVQSCHISCHVIPAVSADNRGLNSHFLLT